MCQESQAILNPQTGSAHFASQKGMSLGSVRHAGDLGVEEMALESHGILHPQHASQKGMRLGRVRHAGEIKKSDM